MSSPASPALRWSRAALLGAMAFLAGVGAHLSADGRLPGPVGLTLLALGCTTGAAMFLGRQASTRRLIVLVVGGQGFVHTGLAALAGHRGDPVRVAPRLHPVAAVDRSGSYFDQWSQTNPA